MKTRDISPTSPGTTRTAGPLTDPYVGTKHTTVSPLAIPVGESSPGNLEAMDIPAPRVAPRGTTPTAPDPEGDDDFGIAAAPSGNTPYGRIAEYQQPASNLPMSVSAAQVARENEERGDNMWPGNRSPLAGTVNDGFAALRRRGGGE